MLFNRNIYEDQKFLTLKGLDDLEHELAHYFFIRTSVTPAITYSIGVRQLYVLTRLAGFAIELQRADDYDHSPDRKAGLHADLRKCLDSFWETPLDYRFITKNL